MIGADPNTASEALPLHVLTGFLGSGKTTILRRLLAQSEERIAVLVNEVGALGLDHLLLERIDEDLLLLPGGCVCCSLRGELHAALARVQIAKPARIVLETTGLADPAPLLHAIGSDPVLVRSLRLAGVITVVDCLRAEELLATEPEARRQLDFADRVLLTKSDLAPAQTPSVRALLEREAPGREIRIAEHGEVDPAWLFGRLGFRGGREADLRAWMRSASGLAQPEVDRSHGAVTTHAIRQNEAIDPAALQLWIRLVTQLDGPRILRIKGIARSADDGRHYVFQSANRSVSPVQAIGRDLPDSPGAEIVIIERGLPRPALEALLVSLRSALGQS